MLNRLIAVCTVVALSSSALLAQNALDALRYSDFNVGGTARSVAVGGALSALGADFTTTSTNPAGIAWHRRSDFVFSPSFHLSSVDATLNAERGEGATINDLRLNFNLNTLGVVIASQPRNTNWSTFNFALGINRLANFHSNFNYEGRSQGSILNRFQNQVNLDGFFGDFESGLAIDAEALYDLEGDGFYETDFELAPDALIRRTQDVNRRGAINELVFSMATNYREKLLLGATLGIPLVSYREEKTYQEFDDGDTFDGDVPFFNELEYTEVLNTTGAGANLKLGAIYRASQAFRIGLAVHTPTAYDLQDGFSTSMEYDYTTDNNLAVLGEADSPEGLFDYDLRTPWRFIGGLSYLYQKSGFLSAEVEYVNYANNEFGFDGFAEDEIFTNADVADRLNASLRFRFGGELVMESVRFRAGANFMQSPREVDDAWRNVLSAGIGFLRPSFYFDVAYQRSGGTVAYTPYLAPVGFPEQSVELDIANHQLVTTFGFRF